jgi:hypothetical protein
MNKEFLKMQKLAGLITEGQYKEKLNENILKVGDRFEMFDDAMGVGTIELVSNYEDHSEEIDDSILESGWESDTPREELTWYKVKYSGDEVNEGGVMWMDEEEMQFVEMV